MLRERQELYQLNLASDTDYKTYIVSDESNRILYTTLKDFNIEPCVAAYALFSTHFVGVDEAMDFIFERRSD